MPQRAPRPCTWPGCGELTTGGACAVHRAQQQAERDARRGSAAGRGYGRRWQAARAAYLRAHPLCRECEQRGLVVEATVVDHVQPHRGDPALFWSRDNWQPLCKRCHDQKTGRGG